LLSQSRVRSRACMTRSFFFCPSQTRSNLAGTPRYMAPESYRDEKCTEKIDIYSLAMMIWEMLTAQLPWDGSNFQVLCVWVGVDGCGCGCGCGYACITHTHTHTHTTLPGSPLACGLLIRAREQDWGSATYSMIGVGRRSEHSVRLGRVPMYYAHASVCIPPPQLLIPKP
jgi:serine/threonine protein kinase